MSNNSDDNDYGDYGGYDDNNYDEFEEEKEIMGEITLTKKKSIVFVTLTDIRQIIKEKCKEINELVGVSDDNALIILNYFQWRKDLVENEWFGNESVVSKKAGIEPVETVPLIKTPTIQCPMCFDQKPKIEFDALKCNHQICRDCWRDYISFNITRPENIFFWKCPFQGCNLVIPETFNLQYTSIK